MSQLNGYAKENNVNLDSCIVFIKGEDDILAVDIANVGIKQRQDTTMGVNFTVSPKQAKNLEEFFDKFHTGEKFYYDISRTGYRPVYFRGLSPITKQVNTQDAKFILTLIMQPAIVAPQDQYFEPKCDCCEFKHIE